ncbi:MAG: DUF6572 domain-containing protein [Verrucomicrobiota bacterium]
MVSFREDLTGTNPPPAGAGLERTGMLDAFAHDTREDVLVLAMFETRSWEHGERQLFQLQEKLNAYVSFILDGEMKDNFPHLHGKPVRIELRTSQEPSEKAMGFLGRARDQLALQQIRLEVVVIGEVTAEGGCCGGASSGGSGCCGGSTQAHHEAPVQESRGACGCGH